MYTSKWFPLLIAYAITCLILITVRPLAIRIGLVDSPDHRKLHAGQIPLIGGIGMFGGFVFAALILSISLQPYRTLFAAAGLLVFLGILDDFHELSARARLVGQLMAALILTMGGGLFLTSLGNIIDTGDILLPQWLSWFLTIFAVMSVINAMNMLDGLDGLAGLIALIGTGSLMILTVGAGDYVTASLIGLVCVVLIAFLQFNWRWKAPARIFMGDAGSMFLGLALVWFAIYCSQAPHQTVRPVTMVWILAVPLCELMTVFIFRLIQRRSPLKAGRDHMHYLLLDYFRARQWPSWCVILLIAGFAGVVAALGVIGEKFQWPASVMFYGFWVIFAGYAGIHGWLQSRHGKISVTI
jgi:UDP-GlcNAc:undecaprenyl-phosphate GlcNAc-1-phosphate transferase